jgi:transcriptional regulator GlxA family with amidase domain
MTGQSENKPIHVSILALPESTPVAIYGLYEVFSSVGVVWPELTGEGEAAPRFDVKIVSLDGKPFTCPIGITIAPNASIADIAETDVVIATDLALPPGFEPGDRWPEMSEWLRARHRDGAIVCSVCTGTVLLAVAGVLDGEDATTHWSACDLFARYFPNVALRPERIVVPAGEGHRVITSGGSSSWEDLALYVIGRLCGPAEAIRTAKIFLFGDRSDGQLPYAAAVRPRAHSDAVIRACQEWVGVHYDDTNPVAKMVARSGLNERTFKRRFRAATGQSPMDYVQTLRIEEAKQELETGDAATDDIALSVGYEDPTYFRRLFKKRTGITPSRYRQRFRTVARLGD